MTAEEIITKFDNQIAEIIKARADLIESMKNKEEKKIEFEGGEDYYLPCTTEKRGYSSSFYSGNYTDKLILDNHMAFKDFELPLLEDFNRKVQILADTLYIKRLYEPEWRADWNNFEQNKWGVCYNYSAKCYELDVRCYCEYPSQIYFSSKEIAHKCADYLNKKYGGKQ